MRSESSARRAVHSAALSTVPLWFGSALGLKNVNRSGRLPVAGMLVTSAGKYARGAPEFGAVPGATVTAPELSAPGLSVMPPWGAAPVAGAAKPSSANEAASIPAPTTDTRRDRTTGIRLIPQHRPGTPSIWGYVKGTLHPTAVFIQSPRRSKRLLTPPS